MPPLSFWLIISSLLASASWGLEGLTSIVEQFITSFFAGHAFFVLLHASFSVPCSKKRSSSIFVLELSCLAFDIRVSRVSARREIAPGFPGAPCGSPADPATPAGKSFTLASVAGSGSALASGVV